MTVQLPETLQYGKVVGRFVLAVADVPEDPDALPNAVPAVGTIKFTSLNPLTKETTATPPTTVVRSVIPAAIDNNGYLYNPKDPTGPRGIWLVAGPYKVSYDLNAGAITGHDILVLPEHDDLTPLDLINPLPPGGPILTASQYAELSSRFDSIEVGAATWDSISSKPTSFPPSTHKGSHASGGSDELTPADIGAAVSGHSHAPPDLSGLVPTSRTINNHLLSADVTLTNADLGAAPATAGVPIGGTTGQVLAKASDAHRHTTWVDSAIPSGLVDAKGDLIVATADNTVTRLPAGSDGHVLTADSAQAAGVKWAALSGGGGGGFAAPFTRSQNGTVINGLPMGDFVGNGTIGATAGRFYGNVFYVPASVSVSSLRIAITVVAAEGALARLALFQVPDHDSLASWHNPIDFGTVSIAATGFVSATLGTPVILNAGVWAVALVADTAVTIGAPRVIGRGVTDWTHQIVANNYRIIQIYQNTTNNASMVAAGITGSLQMSTGGVENGAPMIPALLGFQWS